MMEDQRPNTTDEKEDDKSLADKWTAKIEDASKFEEQWRWEARQCRNIYLNKTQSENVVDTMVAGTLATRHRNKRPQGNIFYSNVQFCASSILSKMPDIVIRERNSKKETLDTQAKHTYDTIADIVQRCCTFLVDTIANVKEMKAFKDDVLIAGRGVLWVLFKSDVDPYSGESTNESINLKHIGVTDFRMSPARDWDEVSWIARRILLSKDKFKEEYGDEAAKQASMTYPNDEDKIGFEFSGVTFESRYEVWEIWDKVKKEVLWVCKGCKDVLRQVPDPFGLDGFFPTPQPLLAVPKSDSLIPTPEFNIYRTEALEIGELSRRITSLVSNMRGRGFVPNTLFKDIKKLQTTSDNSFVVLDGHGVTQLLEKGIQNVIQFEPIEQRASVVTVLGEQLERTKNTIYEITGLSDAMQITNALSTSGGDAETATKTIMKGKFGSIRLQNRQQMFNDYMKEVFGIVAEFVCTKLSQGTAQAITEMQLNDGSNPEDQSVTWEQVIEFLRNNKLRKYLLDVETDMNVWESDEEAQASRGNVFETFTTVLPNIKPMVKEMPTAINAVVLLFKSWLNSFQMPSSERNALDDAINGMAQEVQQQLEEEKQNPPPPPPDEMIAQAEQTKAQNQTQEIQMKGQIAQGELQLKQQDLQVRSQETQARVQSEQMITEFKMAQLQSQERLAQMQAEVERIKIELEMKKLEIEMQQAGEEEQLEMEKIQAQLKEKEAELTTTAELKLKKMDQDQDIAQAKLVQKTMSERERLNAEHERTAVEAMNVRGINGDVGID